MAEENHSGSSDPAVAVVIPTYNRNSKLQRAVDSVLRQTYENWKLYVVNDAPENSIQDVIPDDDRIECIQHDENKGAPAARNTGIQASEASYIALLDDDDAWKPEKLNRQISTLRSLTDDYGLVYTGHDVIRDGEFDHTYIPDISGNIYTKLLFENFVPSPTPMIRRECFEKVGAFDTDLFSAQDYDMWLRIAKYYKFSVISDSLALSYHGHPDRISVDMTRKISGKKLLINKYIDDLEQYPNPMAKHMKQLGIFFAYGGEPQKARSQFISSIKYDRRQATTMLYLLMTLLPSHIQNKFFKYHRELTS